jgi:hypothetical protein
MATRVEPFLDFFDDAIEKAGSAPITPSLRCVDEGTDGSYTAFFGYENENAVSVEIPYGRNNRLAEDDEGARPTTFLPGDHPWSFYVDFTRKEKLDYELRSQRGRCHGDSKATASKRSPRCDETAPDVSCARLCKAFEACELPFSDCMTDCLGSITALEQDFPQCVAPYSALNRCFAEASSDQLCLGAEPVPCEQEIAEYDACFVF